MLLAGCAGFAPDKVQRDHEDDVREAVFRYQIQHLTDRDPSIAQRPPGVFCLALGTTGYDPPDELLHRFANEKPRLKKVSSSTRKGQRVEDNETGADAAVLHIQSIRWLSATKAEAEGSCKFGGSGYGNTYTIIRQNGKWMVIQVRLKWVA